MALQVWLPLNGDTHNQGLIPWTATNTTATVNTDGLFSSCYQFANQHIYGALDVASAFTQQEYTIACWVYSTGSSAAQYYIHCGAQSTHQAFLSLWKESNNHIHVHLHGADIDTGMAMTHNQWIHLAVTYANKTLKLYSNGECIWTYTITPNASWTPGNHLCLGSRIDNSTGSAFKYPMLNNSKLQDIRIYSNCLSPKEIKQLSQGLFIHYLLNDKSRTSLQHNIESHGLPIEYQEVEWIENDDAGLAYIDLGLSFPDPYNGEIKLVGTVEASYLHGTREMIAGFGPGNKGNYLEFYTNNKIGVFSAYAGEVCQTNTPYSLVFKLNKSETSVTVNGITNRTTGAQSASQFNSGYLFTYANTPNQCHNVRWYQVLVYDSETLVRNMIPCYRKSDGKAGMYDKVSNNFFVSVNTSANFTAGPLIKNLSDLYAPLDYIQTANGAYITTSFIPTGDARVKMICQNTQYNSPTAIFGVRTTETTNNFNLWLQSQLFGPQYGNGHAWTSNQVSINLDTNILYIDMNKNNCIINNHKTNFTKETFTCTAPLMLLSLSNNGSKDSRGAWAKVFQCQLYNQDILKHDLRPALRKSDKVAGMYDLITDTFFTSANSTAFTWPNADINMIHDASGYQNNAIISKDVFLTDNSTPRYDKCLYLQNSAIACQLTTSLPKWSISCWYKPSTDISSYQCVFCVTRSTGGDSDKKICYCMANNSSAWIKCESHGGVVGISSPKNQWYHICMVSDGTNYFVYQNGVQKVTGQCGDLLLNCFNLVIGARSSNAANTSYAVPWIGNLVDFRLYATVFNATDVKELYETSMNIDSAGNILPRILTT